MKKSIIIWIIIIIVVVGMITLVTYKKQPGEKEPIKIGAILPLTGRLSPYGQGIKEGLDLALEEINKDKQFPIKIKLISEDYMGDTKNAISAAHKLMNLDKVIALITAVSSHSLAVAPIAEKNKVVLLTMASLSMDLNTAGDYIFKNDDNVSTLGEVLAQEVYDLGHRKVGIIFAQYNDAQVDATDAFQKKFEGLGGEAVAIEGFVQEERDFRSYLTKIDSKNPSAIFINGLVRESGLILKQIRELDLDQQLFSLSAVEDPQVVDTARGAAEEVIFTSFHATPSENFVKTTQEKYGHYPLRWSIEAYDGLKILAVALSRIEGDKISSNLLKEELYKIGSYVGESGIIEFDAFGNAQRQPFIKTIKNGQFVPYEE